MAKKAQVTKTPIDFEAVRRIAVIALFSDDFLFDRIVLKGGNALNLALGISDRTSLDLDFSIENDFENPEEVRQRILGALGSRFSAAGYTVFDFKFEKKPNMPREGDSPLWGGYLVNFKLMEQGKYEKLSGNIDNLRRDSLVVGPNQQRAFSIDLSKCEYVVGKVKVDFDAYSVYVYSSEMIAVEKLRAICQQMPEYSLRRYPAARARDFFDIHLVITKTGINLTTAENLELTRQIFAAKEVPVFLLTRISEFREFHRPDWDSVRASTKVSLEEFDYYFDFVVNLAGSMKTLWDE